MRISDWSSDVRSSDLPADRMLLVNRGEPLGRAGELWFKLSQHPPRRFVHAITQLHPALVHAHFGMDGSLMLPLSRRLNVPLVVTFHGYDVTLRPDAVRSEERRVGERVVQYVEI